MTYAQARERLFAHLRSLGWTVKPNLKVPQAITPSGSVVYFKAQAVYLNSHSLWIDIREVSPSQFVESVMARESSRDPWGTVIRKPFYLIMVYGRWGSEPHSNASTLKEAKAKALAASKRDPKNEYVVEIEPGGFDNPIYKGGKSLRMTKMRSGRLQRRKSVARMGLRKKVGRDPGRKTKSASHGQKASEYVRRGRAAEDEGMFSSAAVWYGKAAAHYAKAYGPHHLRARLWAKRAKDVKGWTRASSGVDTWRPKREMGTTYRGERKAWHRDPGRDFGDEPGHTRESYETLWRQARQAEKAKDYLKASRLYERLADIFPDDHPRGVMFRRRATVLASGTARIRAYLKEAREKYAHRKKRSAAYYAKKTKKSRDPSKRRIVHGRAVRQETASHHAPASKREDKTEYILHWYSRENIGAPTRYESRWFGPSNFQKAKREAEESCDRSESKRFIRLERLTDRDPTRRQYGKQMLRRLKKVRFRGLSKIHADRRRSSPRRDTERQNKMIWRSPDDMGRVYARKGGTYDVIFFTHSPRADKQDSLSTPGERAYAVLKTTRSISEAIRFAQKTHRQLHARGPSRRLRRDPSKTKNWNS